MSHQFYRKSKLGPGQFRRAGIIPYDRLEQMVPDSFPYPINDAVNTPENNDIHEAILENSLSRLERTLMGISADDLLVLLRKKSLSNTPIALAVKLGRWEMFEKIVAVAMDKLDHERCQSCFSARDSMGLKVLSYALMLRAPESVVRMCLMYTNKYGFYYDHKYEQCIDGLSMMDPKFQSTEQGFIIQEDLDKAMERRRGFQIYTLSVAELYRFELPERIFVRKGEIQDQNRYRVKALVKGESMSTLFHQALRNLVFHLPELRKSEGIDLEKLAPSIPWSNARHDFEVEHDYPLWAHARNQRFEPRIDKLITSWSEMDLLEESWVPPTEEELSTLDGAGPASS